VAGSLVAIVTFGALAPVVLETTGEKAAIASVAPEESLLPGAARDAEATIAALVERTTADPDDAKLHAQLGLTYLQRARDEADPSSLPLAERALTRSLELQPLDNLAAFVGMASLGNARHDFRTSVEWSRKAIDTDPYDSSAYGLLGDALFELGKVAQADAAYQRMVEVRPDVASYVRASYALQHHGRTRAALGTMRLALQAAGPAGETAAWVRHQLGDIYAGLGDNRAAARHNRIGTEIAPGYVPPTVGLAEAHLASGRLDAAIEIMEIAADELPSLEYMITLGDLYRATGDAAAADAQYEEVAGKLADYRAAGVRADADFTVFYADHGLRLGAALREARLAYAERPTPKIADALAWVLHARGDDRAAWSYARRAIGGPARDAKAVFHAGTIARGLGLDAKGDRLLDRALQSDPTLALVPPLTAGAQVAARP
jgi:tetratricopeptide (TPR) repeat protein